MKKKKAMGMRTFSLVAVIASLYVAIFFFMWERRDWYRRALDPLALAALTLAVWKRNSLLLLLLRGAVFVYAKCCAIELRMYLSEWMRERRFKRYLSFIAGTPLGALHGIARGDGTKEFREKVPVGGYSEKEKDLKLVFENGKAFGVYHLALTGGTTGEAKRIPLNRRHTFYYFKGGILMPNVFMGARNLAWTELNFLQACGVPKFLSSPGGGVTEGTLSSVKSTIRGVSLWSRFSVCPVELGYLGSADNYWFRGYFGVASCETLRKLTMTYSSDIMIFRSTVSDNWGEYLSTLRSGAPPERVMRAVRGSDRPDVLSKVRSAANPGLAGRLEKMEGDGRFAAFGRVEVVQCMCDGEILSQYVGKIRSTFRHRKLRVFSFGLACTECMYGIQVSAGRFIPNVTYGLVEFSPRRASGGPPVLMQDVEVGQEYGVVVSNECGLLRYSVGDIVRIEGWYASRRGRVPLMSFVGREHDDLSICNERVSLGSVQKALDAGCQRIGAKLANYVCVRYTKDQALSRRYSVYVETDARADALEKEARACLREQHIGYRKFLDSGEIEPMRVRAVSAGTIDALTASLLTTGVGGQIKATKLLNEEKHGDLIKILEEKVLN